MVDICTYSLGLNNQKNTKIIDLGGHKGITKEFFNKSDVTILDLYDEHYEGYVQGDATQLTYNANNFDIAVSFDVFEHIPRAKRSKFVQEAIRVSRLGAFIAAPFDDDKSTVSKTEMSANEIYNVIHGKNHAWLKEHIEYKIPKTFEMEALLNQAGIEYVAINTNDLQIWALLQTLTFIAEKDPGVLKVLKKFEREFNSNLEIYDNSPTSSYRKVYFISEDSRLIDKVKAEQERKAKLEIPAKLQLYKIDLTQTVLLTLLSRINNLQNEYKATTRETYNLEYQMEKLRASFKLQETRLLEYENSLSWRTTRPLRKISGVLRGKK